MDRYSKMIQQYFKKVLNDYCIICKYLIECCSDVFIAIV